MRPLLAVAELTSHYAIVFALLLCETEHNVALVSGRLKPVAAH